MRVALIAALLCSAITFANAVDLHNPALPDPVLTPGAINPAITQENIGKTICAHGRWSTKSIRPPARYTNQLKRRQVVEYGYADTDPRSYEEDHLISLELGGAPRDPRNLWPQPYAGEYGARIKDRLERRLNQLVCNGTLTLRAAQQAIATDWIQAYRQFVLPRSRTRRR